VYLLNIAIDEPISRIVHPNGIYRTPRNRIMPAAWQERSYNKAEAAASYRNLDIKNRIVLKY
jgi:hypothetical protein